MDITSLNSTSKGKAPGSLISNQMWRKQQSDAASLKHEIDRTLQSLLPSKAAPPTDLHEAMSYALLAPGKRLRPMLTLLAADTSQPRPEALQLACVSELVHTASLILDDLPCMDDAKLRRDQPCTHLLYSESTAILASVNLLNLAYGVVAKCPALTPEKKVAVTGHLSDVIGSMGLVGGQVDDLQNRAHRASSLQQRYHRKTGCLFEFAVVTGARLHGMNDGQIRALEHFSSAFGLLFQIYDDMLDHQNFTGKTGKDTGKDVGKSTLLATLSPIEIARVVDDTKRSLWQQLEIAELDNSALGTFIDYQLTQFDQVMPALGPTG